MNPVGVNTTSADQWADGPVGFLRHYKFAEFLSDYRLKAHRKVDGVYFGATAANLKRARSIDRELLIGKLEGIEKQHYSVDIMEKNLFHARREVSLQP